MKGPLVDVSGAIDMHCHPSPDLFPRLADDVEVVEHAQGMGFGAVMIKSHYEPSASRAAYAERMFPGIRVFGGIVLNHAVGGVNPAAVEAALKLGAREVWMPTVDAALPRGDARRDRLLRRPAERGVDPARHLGRRRARRTDAADASRSSTSIAEHDAILGTCHLSPSEIRTLIAEARRRGVQKIAVTHPFFKVPNLTLDELRELSSMGAYAEFGYCTISPMWAYASPKRIAEAVQAIGASHCLLVSDTGQRHNPMPAEALRIFAQCVHESGVSEDDIAHVDPHEPGGAAGDRRRPPARGRGGDVAVSERVRIGLIVPSSNTVMEVDLYRRLPDRFQVHTARMFLEETTPEGEAVMLDEHVMPAARDLGTARPHAVVFGCTSAGALRGDAYDVQLCADISAVTGAETISTIASVRDAIARRGARRIGVITPYVESLNAKIRASIEADGVEVAGIHGLGIDENFAIAEVTPERIVDVRRDRLRLGRDRPAVRLVHELPGDRRDGRDRRRARRAGGHEQPRRARGGAPSVRRGR